MDNKFFFKRTITLYLFFLFLIGLINFIIDPYLRYRKPFYNKIVSSVGSPALYPGVLKNYEYDSLVLGTSMAQNFKVEELNKQFNAKFINVAQSGANTTEIMNIFNSSKKQQVNNIFISLDIFSFDNKRDNTKKYSYLFKSYSLEEYKYLLNIDTLIHILRVIVKKNENPYELGSWAEHGYKFSKDEVLKIKPTISTNENLRINEMKDIYIKTLKKMIEENQKIRFIFFLPPYSLLFYKTMGPDFINFINFKEYLIEELTKYSNVEIHDFQDEFKIISDLNLYYDTKHYSPEVSSLIIKEVKKGGKKITQGNYIKKIENLKYQVENYEIP